MDLRVLARSSQTIRATWRLLSFSRCSQPAKEIGQDDLGELRPGDRRRQKRPDNHRPGKYRLLAKGYHNHVQVDWRLEQGPNGFRDPFSPEESRPQ